MPMSIQLDNVPKGQNVLASHHHHTLIFVPLVIFLLILLYFGGEFICFNNTPVSPVHVYIERKPELLTRLLTYG